ncbi:MAG TPA: GDSL-type esterase/lipase family protein [Allosphingosinicella sp.]|nr:GDSL-type esterase/lipase family protein [Allosphingosinicella sp.]
MTTKRTLLLALDRTAVLFVGIAAGGIIGASIFAGSGAVEAQASTAIPKSAAAAPAAAGPGRPGPRLLRTAAQGGTVNVGVFGDSFGDGLHAGLYQQLPTRAGIAVHKESRQGTGFTRYRTTDLLEDTRRRLAARPVDIAVLSFGANDTQGIYHEGRGAPYMSARWKEIVTDRVTRIVALLRDHGAMVWWVGLPTMRDPEYNAQIGEMNAFYAERMRTLAVPFVDTAAPTAGPDGRYDPSMRRPGSGERFTARAGDGIHMTIPGYLALTRGLSTEIERTIAEARTASGRPAIRNAAPAAAPAPTAP